MKNIFIEYPKCSTCKKAKKWLEEKNFILVIASTTRRNNMNIYCNENKNIITKATIHDYFSLVYTS